MIWHAMGHFMSEMGGWLGNQFFLNFIPVSGNVELILDALHSNKLDVVTFVGGQRFHKKGLGDSLVSN